MQLTGPQKRTLRYYLDHREQPPRIADFFREFGKVLVVWIIAATAASWCLVKIGLPEFAYLAVGVIVGSILREFRRQIFVVRVWPVLAAILDWQRIDDLMTAASSSDGHDSPGERRRE